MLTRETAERTWIAIERARAEKALRESEERYRSLFASAQAIGKRARAAMPALEDH